MIPSGPQLYIQGFYQKRSGAVLKSLYEADDTRLGAAGEGRGRSNRVGRIWDWDPSPVATRLLMSEGCHALRRGELL